MIAALAFLAACAPDPEAACARYVDAWEACYTEAYGESTTTMEQALASACEPYADLEGKQAKWAADLLDCYTDAFSSADCSTDAAYTDTVDSIALSCQSEATTTTVSTCRGSACYC